MSTKFETIGIQNLMEASNPEDLLRRYKWSCNACCYRGMHISCDHCGIDATFHSLSAIMADQRTTSGRKDDKPRGGKHFKDQQKGAQKSCLPAEKK